MAHKNKRPPNTLELEQTSKFAAKASRLSGFTGRADDAKRATTHMQKANDAFNRRLKKTTGISRGR